MEYIHDSPLRQHGNLKPSNCIIDARWSLRLTDYGLENMRGVQLAAAIVGSDRDKELSKYYRGIIYLFLIDYSNPHLSSQVNECRFLKVAK